MDGAVQTLLSCLVRVCPYLCLVFMLSMVLSFLPFMLRVHLTGAVFTLLFDLSLSIFVLGLLCLVFVEFFDWWQILICDKIYFRSKQLYFI